VEKRDYYEVLDIGRDADAAAIKKAYRQLAMKYHPDKNPGDAQAVETMKEINEAYAVLSDGEKRRLYDTYGHAGLQGFTQEDIFRGVDFGSLFEGFFGGGFGGGIFDNFFGRRGGRRTAQPRRGADLRYDLEVTLEDVAFGVEKTLDLSRLERCPACGGAGAKSGGAEECDVCHGTGQRVVEQRSAYSVVRQISACSNCGGKGKIVTQPCDECEGKGVVQRSKEIPVHIPQGADTGYRIRVEGEGEPGAEGTLPGDLYVILQVREHPLFERHGDDVYVMREISFPQAALGGEVDDIPGLEENLKLEIPEGAQTGAVFRILNQGIPHLDHPGRGDEYVVVKVVTPANLTEQQKELLRQFERSRNGT